MGDGVSAVVLPMPDGRIALRVVTTSELRANRACARRHRYAYVLRRRPRAVADVLRFGTLWHIGQEHWWLESGSPAAKLEAAVTAMRVQEAYDPYALVMAEELMVAYTARWGDSDLRALAVEVPFEAPLVNPETGAASRTFKVGGKIDVIVENAHHETFVMEHKTTGADIEEGSTYWKKVRALDGQVSTYDAGARTLGYDVKACIYDVVRKPGLRPLRATPVEARKYTAAGRLYANQRERDETPEEYRLRIREELHEKPERYFARGEIVRLEQDAREHAFDMWQQTRLMREAELSGFAPRNPDACAQFGTCPYFGVCSGEASIDDETLFRTAPTAHEELETE